MIRKIEPADRQNYLLMAEAFYDSDAVIKKIPTHVIEATFDRIIAGSPYLEGYILSDDAGETAGYALLAHSFSQEAGGKVLWVEEVYISPDHRGKGLAKEFFGFIKQSYAGRVKRIRLDVEADNEEAIALYEKMGLSPLEYKQMVIDLD